MTVAVQHTQVGLEWSGAVAILVGHYPRQLMKVIEVVNRPGGKKF
jgi:hypothetical protein